MKLTTPAFSDGGAIPPKYMCDGENVSPPLEWSGLPAGAKCLALIMDDPDAPRGVFLHWLIYGIPASESGLAEGIGEGGEQAGGGTQGRNDFGDIGYGGPCPPSGTHRYYFRLFALDSDIPLKSGASRKQLESAMAGHVLGQTELMGRYTRSR